MNCLGHDFLFVYGTLLKQADNEMSRFLASHSHCIGDGYFQGKLFQVAHYPGAILSDAPADKVYGSVYQLYHASTVFNVLDDYEGINEQSDVPDLYKRILVEAWLFDKRKLKAWVYIYNRPTKGLPVISSGKY
ncbi:gamma-glutamylcyclotransferase [Tamlana fucoidanivorans]|uniref:Gamma-glutamylcyclotransferase n=1 Tax=Allotamlana fucoidanivorans TaxID=2583814 RepID=A0A5C4SIU0_9FLAO|nr:gamma-glutamylcyclotransferase family protein [Tamlana fucoidanivorans]TNJ42974.1 gamma-glutamylcyclotransferase [Tamlana fucoidanivorans]